MKSKEWKMSEEFMQSIADWMYWVIWYEVYCEGMRRMGIYLGIIHPTLLLPEKAESLNTTES